MSKFYEIKVPVVDGGFIDFEDMVWFDNQGDYIQYVAVRNATKEIMAEEDAKIFAQMSKIANEQNE